MARSRFIAGALAAVVGFFVYQCGLFLALDHFDASLVGLGLSGVSATLVPYFGSPAVTGAILQLIGGTFAIAGLLVCISWLGSRPKTLPIPSVSPAKLEAATPVSANVRKCRFCGTDMDADAAFCPKCDRAQT